MKEGSMNFNPNTYLLILCLGGLALEVQEFDHS